MNWRIVLAVCTALCGFSSYAGESMFGYLYTVDTIPKGHWEYEQSHTLRTGKARGSYTAIDVRNEFEYGITDNFQGALYINSSYLNQSNMYHDEDVSMDVPNRNAYNINGVSLEFVYRVWNPITDPIGFAVYVEPELSVRNRKTGEDMIEKAVEFRLLFQKNFLDDQLITAVNVLAEPEWMVEHDGSIVKELMAEFTFGVSYRIMPKWFLGLEFRNHMEFPDMNLGNQEHSAFFVGPGVHYGSEKFWAQLTILPQVSGWPRKLGVGSDGSEVSSPNLHLAQHEKLETRFKFGVNF